MRGGPTGVAADGGGAERAEALAALVSTARSYRSTLAERNPLGRNNRLHLVAASYLIRDAVPTDIDSLVAFTLQEALEAEDLDLQQPAVRRGVSAAFDDAPLARYWVAESGGQVVASVSAITEWSNFHGGQYWWIQSLFILPEHRGTGLLGLLIDHVVHMARAAGAIDLRLYARSSNGRALRAYARCGFKGAPYVLMSRQL